MWEQPQVLSAYFKQKQLEKWNVKVSDDDIVYESDWFPEETMTIWEEIQDNKKTWNKCQKFFEICTLQENSASIPRDKQMKPSTRAPKQIWMYTYLPWMQKQHRITKYTMNTSNRLQNRMQNWHWYKNSRERLKNLWSRVKTSLMQQQKKNSHQEQLEAPWKQPGIKMMVQTLQRNDIP